MRINSIESADTQTDADLIAKSVTTGQNGSEAGKQLRREVPKTMKPYYEDESVKLFHGDSREVLSSLPKCDLLLTDPPYQQSKSGGGLIAKRETYAAIRPLSDFDPAWLLSTLSTVGKFAHGYIFCSKDLLPAYTAFLRDSGWGWDMLAYTKANPLPTKNNKYLSDIEYLLFYREAGKCYFNNEAPFHFYSKVKRTICAPSEFGHPTEKDVDIIGQLIQVSTAEGDLILDPFVGSGTTLVAAKAAGRQSIGVEIEEHYCEIAARRIERQSRQQTMDFKATQESMVFA